MAKWNPSLCESFSWGEVINELVGFIPDVTINCDPPYIRAREICVG